MIRKLIPAISCALSLKGQILVSVNGSFAAPNGVVFEREDGFEEPMYAGESRSISPCLGCGHFFTVTWKASSESACNISRRSNHRGVGQGAIQLW